MKEQEERAVGESKDEGWAGENAICDEENAWAWMVQVKVTVEQ